MSNVSSMVRRRRWLLRATCIAMALVTLFVTACTTTSGSETKKKLSIPEAEAGLGRMFSDEAGKATFSCVAGSGRHEFICQGRYVPIDRNEGVIAHRIGASVSHYYEGQPVFAVTVLRDGAGSK